MLNSSATRKAKIVCTLGPASNTKEKILTLIKAGMDVARLNFSHGTHEMHRMVYQNVREASKEAGKFVGVLQDLQGPKLRLGKLPKEGVTLNAGDEVLLYPEGTEPPTGKSITLPLSNEIAEPISHAVKPGSRVLFDDGKINSVVVSSRPPFFSIKVIAGGKLTSNKGLNLPGTPLPIPSVTEKDLEDLKLGLELGVDFVALSFVRSAKEIEKVKDFIRKESNRRPLIVSKIEREEAIEDLDSIIDVSDGILIARGDMAVELGAEHVPVIQKRIIRACAELGVPVITATQMLESMISCSTPTRAEASDVANAVFDGTDAVMLSAETASGEYSEEAVLTMSRIVMEAEKSSLYSRRIEVLPLAGSVVDSIEFSASRIAMHTGARAIACLTHSGTAARILSKFRPSTPIVAIMDNEESLRKLALHWGVRGVLIPNIVSTDDLFLMVEEVLVQNKFAEIEDLIVVTAGVPTLRRGTTNMVKVHRVGANVERRRPGQLSKM